MGELSRCLYSLSLEILTVMLVAGADDSEAAMEHSGVLSSEVWCQ